MLAMAGVEFKLASYVRCWDGREGWICVQTSSCVGGICIISLCLPAGSPPPHTRLSYLLFFTLSSSLSRLCLIITFRQPPSSPAPSSLCVIILNFTSHVCLCGPSSSSHSSPVVSVLIFIASMFCELIEHIFCCATCHHDHPASKSNGTFVQLLDAPSGQRTQVCLKWSSGSRPAPALCMQLPS